MTSKSVFRRIECDKEDHAMKILVSHDEEKPRHCQTIATKNDVVVSSNEDSALDYAVLKLNASHFVDELPLQVSSECLEPGGRIYTGIDTITLVLPYPEDLVDWLKSSRSAVPAIFPHQAVSPTLIITTLKI